MAQAINWVIPVYGFKMLSDIMATAHEWMSHKMWSGPPLGQSHGINSISERFRALEIRPPFTDSQSRENLNAPQPALRTRQTSGQSPSNRTNSREQNQALWVPRLRAFPLLSLPHLSPWKLKSLTTQLFSQGNPCFMTMLFFNLEIWVLHIN